LPVSIETDRIPLSADPEIDSTFDGMMIDSIDVPLNAFDSIRFNFDDDSNVIDFNEGQSLKQFEPRISTFDGMMIDSIDVPLNAFDSICFNFDDDSNVIDFNE
jgi:hypothetical protein